MITAVVLFLPIGIACYVAASAGGVLTASSLVGSIVLGAALMASPIVFLKLKSRPYFRQGEG